ncbi:hypothetical protein MAR_022927 [Mya arenaria]|uniref:Mitochondria-eating protein C-terminal domain-containing protein n=1 Tax=Mya arenaria TaxID=6604 RepID=A0ABY7DPS0_MYAAR|nr:hypothetical protein MAR_022927 [Mya arenaria]
MSRKGQPFNNDSGDKNVGDTDPDADNTQPLPMKKMDKPKNHVGQTAASNDESEERSEKKKDDSVSKSVTTDEEKDRTNVLLTTKIEQLEHKNRELEQSLYETNQELIKEKEKNKQELKLVVEDKVGAVMKSAAAEEEMERHKSDIEDKTHTIFNFHERIRQMEEAARVSDRKKKSLTESINKLKEEVRERDQTIGKEKESTKKLKKTLNETKSREKDLQQKEKQLNEKLASFQTSYNELVQSKHILVENLKEMEASKSKLEKDLSRKIADYHKLDGHCLDVCWNYDAAVKESLTNLIVTSEIKVLTPERTKQAEHDACSLSEKDTTLPLKEESKEEMTWNIGIRYTYLWHNKETEDIGGGWTMIKFNNDIDVKCISPESMTGSECTRLLTGERKREENGEEGAEEEDGKGGKTEENMDPGSFKQTGKIEAEKEIEGELSDENNEYNPDVKTDNEPSELKSDFNVKTEGNECNGDISQHDVEPKEEKQTKQDEHKENVIHLKFDFDTLTNSHKQTISEIRRIVHAQLEDQVVKAISQAVFEEMELPRETGIVSYVEECAKICWLARLHDPPIYIEFEEIEDDSPFKAEMYKAYTKTGKRLDYVVWPPVFLYKNGPILSKGVAQGK